MMTFRKLLAAIAAAGMLGSCSQKKGDQVAADYSKPLSGTVDTGTAKRYVLNYEPRAGFVKKGKLRQSGTRCVWFSIGQLDSLVQRIKSEKGDGIRFYFAAYDSIYPPPKNGAPGNHIPLPNYWGFNTLLMVSTEWRDGYHFDYYKPRASDGSYKGPGIAIAADPNNQGELCPPPEKCNDLGATLLP